MLKLDKLNFKLVLTIRHQSHMMSYGILNAMARLILPQKLPEWNQISSIMIAFNRLLVASQVVSDAAGDGGANWCRWNRPTESSFVLDRQKKENVDTNQTRHTILMFTITVALSYQILGLASTTTFLGTAMCCCSNWWAFPKYYRISHW